jgi:hypothetical protein
MRALITAAIAGLGLSVGAGLVPAAAQSTLEDKVKAAMVSKFPQFVEWPPTALADGSTIDLCVASAGALQFELEELAAGETLGSRQLTVRRVQRSEDIDRCHVLFIRGAAVPANRGLLQRATGRPVLTVSDDQKFLDQGGIVQLRQVGGRLRFDIDAGAARKAGLRISSQLLQLALTLRGGPE